LASLNLFQSGDHRRALQDAAHAEPLGLYLHIPFCVDRCTYCSFITTREDRLKPVVLDRLERDLRAWGEFLGHPEIDTLYLGGGTPSVLSADELLRLSEAVQASFRTSGLREATLEANPGNLDSDWLMAARGCGWARLSLGVQTLDDELLEELGRIHSSTQALEAFEAAQHAGFERISADLMVGVPGQCLDGVLEDAERLIQAGAEHLSIYLLDLDKNCPMKARVASGRLVLPSDDEVADVFEALQSGLPRMGLEPYEISNYAVPGQESIHNTRYWERRPYLGLGPSAASQLGKWRWTEGSAIQAWAEGTAPIEREELGPAESLAEIPLLGLRMHHGVDWTDLRLRAEELGLLGLLRTWERELEPFVLNGLLEAEGRRLRLTNRGRLLSNAVLQVFV